MARKIPENADGRFYVDEKCINCSLCSEIARDIFSTNHEEGFEYVKKQPHNDEEIRLVQEVMRLCPASAVQDSEKNCHKKSMNHIGRKL